MLAARLMNLGKQDLVGDQRGHRGAEKEPRRRKLTTTPSALALTEDWDDKKNDGTLITPATRQVERT